MDSDTAVQEAGVGDGCPELNHPVLKFPSTYTSKKEKDAPVPPLAIEPLTLRPGQLSGCLRCHRFLSTSHVY